MEINYEKKFLYRLIKVIYLVILISGIIYALQINKLLYGPTKYINENKSYVSGCYQGKTSTFKDIGIGYGYENTLDKYTELAINYYCFYGEQRLTYINNILAGDKVDPKYKNYSEIYPVYNSRGSWLDVLIFSAKEMFVMYIILNTIKELLYYVFLGKIFELKRIVLPFNMRWHKHEG